MTRSLRSNVGLNADWCVVAYHFGPSSAPNLNDGDLYVIDQEEQDADGTDLWAVVRRYTEPKYENVECHDIAEGDLEACCALAERLADYLRPGYLTTQISDHELLDLQDRRWRCLFNLTLGGGGCRYLESHGGRWFWVLTESDGCGLAVPGDRWFLGCYESAEAFGDGAGPLNDIRSADHETLTCAIDAMLHAEKRGNPPPDGSDPDRWRSGVYMLPRSRPEAPVVEVLKHRVWHNGTWWEVRLQAFEGDYSVLVFDDEGEYVDIIDGFGGNLTDAINVARATAAKWRD